jgi:hypothetical protein
LIFVKIIIVINPNVEPAIFAIISRKSKFLPGILLWEISRMPPKHAAMSREVINNLVLRYGFFNLVLKALIRRIV